MYKIGNYVTRKKYNNDILFKIVKIDNDKVILKGVDLRLYADTNMEDLQLAVIHKKKENKKIEMIRNINLEDYFYIPGTILHIDSDDDYLEKCSNYYNKQKVKSYGYIFKEKDYPQKVIELIKKHNPKIVVITGHDAYYEKENKYRNSKYFIEAVKEIRSIKDYSNIKIISGACQSDFENLIKYGSTFASSPYHINIHALDPAIVASFLALTSINETINLNDILDKTKYGKKGIGGIEVNGTMIVGMPRKDIN